MPNQIYAQKNILLWLNGKKPKLSYLKAFICKYFVLNNGKDDLGKFDPKSYEGIFVGYFQQEKHIDFTTIKELYA